MDKNMQDIINKRMNMTAEALKKNNIEAFVAEDCKEACEIFSRLVEEHDVISCGGTMTLGESGILEIMKSGKYDFIDRSQAKNREEVEEIYRKAFFCDAYITSANAVTENGEIYNVDGNSNRIAAISYGPEKVIFVVGYNKIVPTLDDAVIRVKTTAASANCIRLNMKTPCAATGKCICCNGGSDLAKGCLSDGRVCSNYLVSAYQRNKDRMKMIIVGEELGY